MTNTNLLSIARSIEGKFQLMEPLIPAERAVLRSQVEKLAADLLNACDVDPTLCVDARRVQVLVKNFFNGADFTETAAAIHQTLGGFAAKV